MPPASRRGASTRPETAGNNPLGKIPAMRALRRALLALGAAGILAAIVRLRGTGGTPPQNGGWRELSGPDLR
jgi:hypothetical protein